MVASPSDTGQLNFEQLLQLRRIRDNINVALGYCLSNLEVMKCVRRSQRLSCPQSRRRHIDAISSADKHVQSYVQSLRLFKDRVTNTIELVSFLRAPLHWLHRRRQHVSLIHLQLSSTLDMRTQNQAASLNQEMRNLSHETSRVTTELAVLTQNSASEGKIMRVITIVSAIYLPGSFVTVTAPRSIIFEHL